MILAEREDILTGRSTAGGGLEDVADASDAGGGASGGGTANAPPQRQPAPPPPVRDAPPRPGPADQQVAQAETIPENVPSGEDDDVIARQLREAAMNEPDPELREKLWDEYRRYKASQP